MTIVVEHIKKLMGWCPNTSSTKRVLVTFQVDEEFFQGRGGKKETAQIKTSWANTYRNYILLQTVLGVAGFVLASFIFRYLFQIVLNLPIIFKGTLIGIIISAFAIFYDWKQLNRIDRAEVSLMKNTFLQTFSELAIFFTGITLLIFTIGKEEPIQFMLSIFFPLQWIHYPVVAYWERKNRKRIYLFEEKLLRWKPVVLPGHA